MYAPRATVAARWRLRQTVPTPARK